jgi:glyoxylase-like metal-dependent hydrolase (beta-lactamase superfamily II)
MEPTPLVRVIDGVYRWSVWNEPRKLWFNGHLLRVGDLAVLVDPVAAREDVCEAIEEASGRCDRTIVVVTNRDHTRAADDVRRRFGAEVWVAAGDADAIAAEGLVADERIDDGDTIGELCVVRVAGAKTAGEIAVHWPARKLVVLGDAARGKPPGALSLLPADKLPDVAAAQAGVVALGALGVDVVLVGDGDDVTAGGSAALAAVATTP